MSKKYNTIIFDLGNTLIRFDHNIAVKKLEKRFRIDRDKTYSLFFDSEITHLFETGRISPQEFYRKATAMIGISLPYEEFIDVWNDIFWEDEEACGLARQLKKSYKLVLLSNISPLHFEHIVKKFDIMRIFDEIVPSFKVGVMKPDEAIFRHAIKAAGGDASKLFYTDDREEFIKVAQKLGIDSVRFENAEHLKGELKTRGII